MSLEINDQYDFFQAVQLDDDGNLLVKIVNPSSGGTVSGDYLPLSGGTLSGLFSFAIDSGGATATFDATLDGGSGATMDFEYNVNNGYVGRASLPVKESPYKIERIAPGSAYTFSDNLNMLSITELTQECNVVLPEFPNYSTYIVKDSSGDSYLYPITVSAGRRTINGEENYIINIKNKASITFLWDGNEFITI